MQLTIGKKLGLGFAAVLALMVTSAAVVYFSVSNMNANVAKAAACDQMLTGLNAAVAALRGYLILGDDPKQAEFFRNERQEVWKNIDAAMANLKGFYAHASNAEDATALTAIGSDLEGLRTAQQSVEDIAQTKENLPAQKLFEQEAAPAAKKILEKITSALDAEKAQPATAERKELLANLADFRGSFAESVAALRGFLLAGDDALRQEFDAKWTINQAAYKAVNDRLQLFAGGQADDWGELQTQRRAFEPIAEKIFALRSAADWNVGVHRMETQSAPKAKAMRIALEGLKARAAADRESASRLVVGTLLAATLLALAIGAAVAVVLSRRMSSAIGAVLARVRTVAAGDLTGDALRVPSADEIGNLAQGFNQMVAALRRILADAAGVTREVATASTEIATGAQQQLAGLSQTAASLNEITATSEEFKATMQEFADRARAVQEAATETAKRSSEGRKLTRDSAERIDQVRSNAQAAGEAVLNLSDQMQRIGEITATVNEIAEQTKLLALNASIEAARAGEEGRGFAVVATQVRDLANQSKEAVARIEGLIAGTQKSMQDVAAKIEEGGRLSEDSREIVRQVAQAFEEIAQAIDHTREAMVQINTGARQQEQGIGELVASIAQIDSASKESLAAAEQTQRSIVSIDQRIRVLNDAIAQFKV